MQEEIKFYKKILHKLNNTVIDVGCRTDNIFYDLKPGLEVHLFDPKKSSAILNFAEMIDKIPNVHFNNYGLGSNKETLNHFYAHYDSLRKNAGEPKWEGKHYVTSVDIDTLYNYIEENNIEKIDLLKIDTEAWDFEVIKGAGKYIWDIEYIQFEGDWPVYGDSDTMDDIFAYFNGYNIYMIGGHPRNFVITKNDLTEYGYLKYR